MKSLKVSAKITAILGFFSFIALILLFLALNDIANNEPDLTLEWYTTGICIIVLIAFTISTFFTLGNLYKSQVLSRI